MEASETEVAHATRPWEGWGPADTGDVDCRTPGLCSYGPSKYRAMGPMRGGEAEEMGKALSLCSLPLLLPASTSPMLTDPWCFPDGSHCYLDAHVFI